MDIERNESPSPILSKGYDARYAALGDIFMTGGGMEENLRWR